MSIRDRFRSSERKAPGEFIVSTGSVVCRSSLPLGQRTVSEISLTAFPAISIYPRFGIFRFASETDDVVVFPFS